MAPSLEFFCRYQFSTWRGGTWPPTAWCRREAAPGSIYCKYHGGESDTGYKKAGHT